MYYVVVLRPGEATFHSLSNRTSVLCCCFKTRTSHCSQPVQQNQCIMLLFSDQEKPLFTACQTEPVCYVFVFRPGQGTVHSQSNRTSVLCFCFQTRTSHCSQPVQQNQCIMLLFSDQEKPQFTACPTEPVCYVVVFRPGQATVHSLSNRTSVLCCCFQTRRSHSSQPVQQNQCVMLLFSDQEKPQFTACPTEPVCYVVVFRSGEATVHSLSNRTSVLCCCFQTRRSHCSQPVEQSQCMCGAWGQSM